MRSVKRSGSVRSLAEVLSQIDAFFLDSAPVIYFVEEKEPFFSRARPFFDQIDDGQITAVSSPITLAECLFYPYKQRNEELAAAFNHRLVHGEHVRFIHTTAAIADLSARLRAEYHLGFADGLYRSQRPFMPTATPFSRTTNSLRGFKNCA